MKIKMRFHVIASQAALIVALQLVSCQASAAAQGKPSFDCAKAQTAVEKQTCADGQLAALDVAMVAAYNHALNRLPLEERAGVRRQHLEWFKIYRESCNAAAQAESGAHLKECIAKALSDHARDLASPDNDSFQVVGGCTTTTVSKIGTRLSEGENGPDVPGSGSLVLYANGGVQVSYETVPGIEHSHVGDKVLVCFVSIPRSCPAGDDRGKMYTAKNLRTGGTWTLPDSQHSCGGA
ncbi:MAG TPA: hypothetical protein VJ723_13265 [Candidatus Angelobacter sp.]|nr:hypothetical protein [Candidatus Angelobacter sp.]